MLLNQLRKLETIIFLLCGYYIQLIVFKALKNGIGAGIDYLYLDSDHSYQHVANEINAWNPHLSEKCVVMVEDTYPRPWDTFTEQQRREILSTKNNGEQPCDPHWALHDFAKLHMDWELIKFTYPEGKTLMMRGFNI